MMTRSFWKWRAGRVLDTFKEHPNWSRKQKIDVIGDVLKEAYDRGVRDKANEIKKAIFLDDDPL